VRPSLSEFSYGYALTSELVSRFGVRAAGAPVSPSLVDEGRLGYDVSIPGVALFLQFKLADPMVRGSSKEAELLGTPYYRMHLRSGASMQHELLVRLQKRGNDVYYAAPQFHEPMDLNRAYVERRVLSSTAFWSPAAIGPLPIGRHYVAFARRNPIGLVCSTPKAVEKTSLGNLLHRDLRASAARRSSKPTEHFFRYLADELAMVSAEAGLPQPLSRRLAGEPGNPIDEAVWLAQLVFGCALLFVPLEVL
jgi:hypothetical protein